MSALPASHRGDGEALEWSASVRSGRWDVQHVAGSVAALHGIDPMSRPGAGDRPAALVCEPSGAAIVLGSTQAPSLVDVGAAARWGLDIVRRRSGGGAVLVAPADVVWVDLWVPRDDALWRDDVGVAMHWVGAAWAAVAGRLGVDAGVHTGGMEADALGRLVCFVGVGPGEVLVDGAKLVGVSQRRGRAGARFQCQWVRRWAPDALLDCLAITDAGDRHRVAAAGVGVAVDACRVIDALTEALAER